MGFDEDLAIWQKIIQSLAEKEKPPSKDELTEKELKDFEKAAEAVEREEEDLEQQAQKENIEDQKLRRKLREKYSPRLFWLLIGWLVVVTTVIFFDAFSIAINCHIFEMSDAVLITLITTTTANIVALFYIVAKHLFPKLEK